MENVTIVVSGLMFVFFVFDLLFSKNVSLIFALVSSPFLSGAVMFFSMFRTFFLNKKNKWLIKFRHLFMFLSLLIVITVSYYNKSVSYRAIIQAIQFLLLLSAVWFVIIPNKVFIHNPEKMLISLMVSSVLLCFIKLFSFIIGDVNFNINGQNEDSFLLVLIGCISGLLYFRSVSISSILYFALLFFALFLYGSRAAQVMVFLTISAYYIASLTKFNIKNMLFIFILFLSILLIILFNIDDVKLFFISTTDLERNHSNIERMAMYVYTFDYLSSGGSSYGLGNIEVAMNDMRSAGVIIGHYPHPHSSYLRFALEFGIAGAAGFVTFFGILLFKAMKMYSYSPRLSIILIIAVVNVFVFSFVESVFFSFFRASAVLLILALIIARSIDDVDTCKLGMVRKL